MNRVCKKTGSCWDQDVPERNSAEEVLSYFCRRHLVGPVAATAGFHPHSLAASRSTKSSTCCYTISHFCTTAFQLHQHDLYSSAPLSALVYLKCTVIRGAFTNWLTTGFHLIESHTKTPPFDPMCIVLIMTPVRQKQTSFLESGTNMNIHD